MRRLVTITAPARPPVSARVLAAAPRIVRRPRPLAASTVAAFTTAIVQGRR